MRGTVNPLRPSCDVGTAADGAVQPRRRPAAAALAGVGAGRACSGQGRRGGGRLAGARMPSRAMLLLLLRRAGSRAVLTLALIYLGTGLGSRPARGEHFEPVLPALANARRSTTSMQSVALQERSFKAAPQQRQASGKQRRPFRTLATARLRPWEGVLQLLAYGTCKQPDMQRQGGHHIRSWKAIGELGGGVCAAGAPLTLGGPPPLAVPSAAAAAARRQ
jgi:hypothetical protein